MVIPAGKSVLLIIGGGIAAYKSLELIRLLRGKGIATRVIMTKAAEHFVTPLSVAALAGEKVFSDLFSLTDETEMGHIELSRSTDLLVVAPATADLMAKMAQGIANDLASTALLATDKPVLLAPAMNVRMWHHAATQRNLAILKGDGIHLVGTQSRRNGLRRIWFGPHGRTRRDRFRHRETAAPDSAPAGRQNRIDHGGPDTRAD